MTAGTRDVHRNLTVAQALKRRSLLPTDTRCYFAGLVYDLAEDTAYQLSGPVQVEFDAQGRLIIPLPSLNNHAWQVDFLEEGEWPEEPWLLTEGPVREANVWEFVAVDAHPSIGEPTVIDVDRHWPEWAASMRRYQAVEGVTGLEETLHVLGFTPVLGQSLLGVSGIYVLHLANDRYYVGQSVDIAARLAAHRRTYADIRAVNFLRLRRNKDMLDEREIETIRILEEKGTPLLNIVHASITYQSSAFDDLVSPEAQRRWLEEPSVLGPGETPAVADAIRAKQAGRLKRLQQHPLSNRVIPCLQRYIHHCIPRPLSTAPEYWGISCTPSTNASYWPRLACVNSNTMEIFVIGHDKRNREHIWAFVNLSAIELSEHYSDDHAFLAVHPNATIEQAGYAAGGHDQLRIEVHGIAEVERLLADQHVLAAARIFNLHLMRKRANFFARFHSYDLADHLISNSMD